MKTHNIFKVLLASALITATACSDEFLEKDAIGKIPSEDFFNNENNALASIYGVYDLMQWNYGRDWNSAYFAKNLPGDDCNAGSSASDQLPYQNLDDFKQQADNTVTTAIWEGFYKTINACNTIIINFKTNTPATSKIIAEAKAIRAFTYFELVVMFGDVPYYTDNANEISETKIYRPRTAKATIYTQIEKDLADAIEVLPGKTDYDAANKFRMSRGTARAILGKALLYQGKWAAAHAQLSQLINTENSGYGLETDFTNVWLKAGALGIESVLEVCYTSQEGYDWGNFGWSGNHESNIHVQLMGPRDNLFKDVAKVGLLNGWGFNLPTKKIGDAFVAAGDKGARYQATLMSAEEFEAAGGTIDTENGTHDYEGYLRMKYATRTSETNTSGGVTPELNYGVNWRLIRWADVLLMAAEAYNEDGKPDLGVKEINKVRQRAQLDLLPEDISQSDLRAAIIKERQLELAFEGSRFWDLVRWNLAEQELGSLGFVKGKHEVFPIPANEIKTNTALTDKDQNPGY
ncbi:MAG: RagB/SusD family nutrient uptake outer membrane protein [Marinilabiliaceae bacterium]|nr:RagB/SusD family nutrient uptake outer membrane protein [Marinilabiliaceae bacterium]